VAHCHLHKKTKDLLIREARDNPKLLQEKEVHKIAEAHYYARHSERKADAAREPRGAVGFGTGTRCGRKRREQIRKEEGRGRGGRCSYLHGV
jgi:hypothetical protein